MEPNFAGISAVVVGGGSIGRRHERILREGGAATALVSASEPSGRAFRSLADAMVAAAPDYLVIANHTSAHLATIAEASRLGFTGRLLVEKPLAECSILVEDRPFKRAAVAYNLRFHPTITRLRQLLVDERPVFARLHVGQHLAQWRPNRDFRASSSASAEAGGGALRDLSHELDLLLHLFGPWRRLTAIGGNRGVLGIETDEVWSILVELASGVLTTVSINYYDDPPERRIVVNTAKGSLSVDLIAGNVSRGEAVENHPASRDFTYICEHQAMFDNAAAPLCTFREATEVLIMIEAVERAARERCWVTQ